MQVKWLFPSWLLQFLPSFVFPTQLKSSHSSTTSRSSSSLSSLKLIEHHSKSVHTTYFSSDHYHFLGNVRGAWTAAVQAAAGLLPWLGINGICGKGQRYGNSRSNRRSWIRKRTLRLASRNFPIVGQRALYGNIVPPVSLVYLRFFFTIFERLLNKADRLCFAAVLAVTAAIMPPLENSPSKVVPPHVDIFEDGDPDKEISVSQAVMMGQIGELQICHSDYGLKADGLDNVVEPKTGFKFPMVLSRDICEDQTLGVSSQVLAGVGVRNQTIVKLKSIKIYAFGFYIKIDGLKAQLGEKYGVIPPEELKHKSCFYEDILRHDLEMTVRLVVYYKGLKMGMVRSAFDTSLKNRLKKIKGEEGDDGLDIFNSYFSENLSLSRGTVIDFQWLPGGQLRTEIDGKLIGTIHSRDFCRAFFDIYIGDPPVSMKVKEDIGEKLGHMLRMS